MANSSNPHSYVRVRHDKSASSSRPRRFATSGKHPLAGGGSSSCEKPQRGEGIIVPCKPPYVLLSEFWILQRMCSGNGTKPLVG